MRDTLTLMWLLPSLAFAEDASSVRWTLHGIIDTYWAFHTNRPAGGAGYFAGAGSTGGRSNAFAVNLAAIDASATTGPVVTRLALQVGTSADIVHVAEPGGVGLGPELWRHLQRASVAYTIPVGRGLTLEAGVMPSHNGYETYVSKDNWNYSRSWAADLSPYYECGVSLRYPMTEAWSVQLHVVNGWQTIGDLNEMKSFGLQVAYGGSLASAALNLHAGPELPGDNRHWRFFADVWAQVDPLPWLSLATVVDAAYEDRPSDPAWWLAGGLFVRFNATAWFKVALRGGIFHDPDGAISGTAQTLGEASLTLDFLPIDGLLFRLEGRFDQSTAALFETAEVDADGPRRSRRQGVILLAATGWF